SVFLDRLSVRNPTLISAAVDLHQRGLVPANSFLLDVDTMAANAAVIAREARGLGLTVFAMTKQFGRNPVATRAVIESGLDGVVAVDLACALAFAGSDIPLGHVGHLVQIPRHE